MSDLEEVVADYYPHLEVGARHEYNGVGYAIGGKIIETISGEAVPLFYKKHLLDPLGCTNTDVLGTYGDAYSVPLDIAKIGQMLLNRGTYGNMRFFSEETFEKMLPQPLTKLLGPDTTLQWGIGTVWMGDNGSNERTFGHGAASAAIFRMDPVNDLIIVQTRNTAGPEYGKYAPRFIKTIVDQIGDRPQ
jgi:CubicO group peptidase (beta-lactamase class C family)